jgi:hypothetical protein
MNWQPVTHNDQADVRNAPAAIPFELNDLDRAHAAAARYYLQQHVQNLNQRAKRQERSA